MPHPKYLANAIAIRHHGDPRVPSSNYGMNNDMTTTPKSKNSCKTPQHIRLETYKPHPSINHDQRFFYFNRGGLQEPPSNYKRGRTLATRACRARPFSLDRRRGRGLGLFSLCLNHEACGLGLGLRAWWVSWRCRARKAPVAGGWDGVWFRGISKEQAMACQVAGCE